MGVGSGVGVEMGVGVRVSGASSEFIVGRFLGDALGEGKSIWVGPGVAVTVRISSSEK